MQLKIQSVNKEKTRRNEKLTVNVRIKKPSTTPESATRRAFTILRLIQNQYGIDTIWYQISRKKANSIHFLVIQHESGFHISARTK